MLTHFLRTIQGSFPKLNNITTTTKGTTGTTFTINLPSNLTSGDGILIIVSVQNKPTISTPTGWTLVATGLGSFSDSPRTSIFIKVSDGTEGSTTSVTLGVANAGTAIATRITNWTSATTSVEGTVIDAGSTGTPNPPSETASWGNDYNLFVAIAAVGANITPVTYPTSYRLYRTVATNGSALDAGESAIAARSLVSATDDPTSFTISGGGNESCIAGTIVIRGRS